MINPQLIIDDTALVTVPNSYFLRHYEDNDKRDFYFAFYRTSDMEKWVKQYVCTPWPFLIELVDQSNVGTLMEKCKIISVKPRDSIIKIGVTGEWDRAGKAFDLKGEHNIITTLVLKEKS